MHSYIHSFTYSLIQKTNIHLQSLISHSRYSLQSRRMHILPPELFIILYRNFGGKEKKKRLMVFSGFNSLHCNILHQWLFPPKGPSLIFLIALCHDSPLSYRSFSVFLAGFLSIYPLFTKGWSLIILLYTDSGLSNSFLGF